MDRKQDRRRNCGLKGGTSPAGVVSGGEYSTSSAANSQTAAVMGRRNQCHLSYMSDGCGRGGEEVKMEGAVAHGLLPWQWVPCRPAEHKLIPVFLAVWHENSSLRLSLCCQTLSPWTSHPLWFVLPNKKNKSAFISVPIVRQCLNAALALLCSQTQSRILCCPLGFWYH